MKSYKMLAMEKMYGVEIIKMEGYNYAVDFNFNGRKVRTFQPLRLHEVKTFLDKFCKRKRTILEMINDLKKRVMEEYK